MSKELHSTGQASRSSTHDAARRGIRCPLVWMRCDRCFYTRPNVLPASGHFNLYCTYSILLWCPTPEPPQLIGACACYLIG